MEKKTIEVSADLLVSVRFTMEIDEGTALKDMTKIARDASERVAQSIVGDVRHGAFASASVRSISSFSMKL